MRDNLPTMLRAAAEEWREKNKVIATGATRYDAAMEEAADAIEELQGKADAYLDAMTYEHNRAARLLWDKEHCWIPVTERLPKEMERSCGGWSAEIRPSDDVLVWLSPEKRQSVAWYSHTYNDWTTADEKTVYCFGEVTHWMPLPQPPTECRQKENIEPPKEEAT